MDDADYLRRLLHSYEEERMGEAYFRGLAGTFPHGLERESLLRLAEVERRTAMVLRPLLDRHGLLPREEALLQALGAASSAEHQDLGWQRLMEHMLANYPAYLREFRALERMAPDGDREALGRLTLHEVVLIDFASRELRGDPDSLSGVMRYLADDPDRQWPVT